MFLGMLHLSRRQNKSVAGIEDPKTFAINLLTRHQQLKPRPPSQRWLLLSQHLKIRPPVDFEQVAWNLAQSHLLFFVVVTLANRFRESLGDEVAGSFGDSVSQSHMLWLGHADFVLG